jgi:hypothetical protein
MLTYTNEAWGYSIDYPPTFSMKPADADGRGQSFYWTTDKKVTIRAQAQANSPKMTVAQLYTDWSRHGGKILRQEQKDNGWLVIDDTRGTIWCSKGFLHEDVIASVQIEYEAKHKDALDPICEQVMASLKVFSRKKK